MDHPVGLHIIKGRQVHILKGIHPDTKGRSHITIKVKDQTYHINLKKSNYKRDSKGQKTFVWKAAEIK